MVKPFDPEEGIFFNYSEIFESIDDQVPEWLQFEIERTMVDELGLTVRDVVASGAPQSALVVYTASLEGGNVKVGRFILSPKRWGISSGMAHNVYIRYTRTRILQFFFHAGWDKDSVQWFVRTFRSQLLSTKAWNPRYKMTVKELIGKLKDIRLSGFWGQFKDKDKHE